MSGTVADPRVLARTTISMPESLMEKIDAHCERTHQDRSGYIRQAVQADLDRHRQHSALLDLLSEAQSAGVNVETLVRRAIRRKTIAQTVEG